MCNKSSGSTPGTDRRRSPAICAAELAAAKVEDTVEQCRAEVESAVMKSGSQADGTLTIKHLRGGEVARGPVPVPYANGDMEALEDGLRLLDVERPGTIRTGDVVTLESAGGELGRWVAGLSGWERRL